MIEFMVAVFLLLITPGPGVLSTAGVGSAFGWGPGLSYMAGLCVGGFVVMVLVITGLAGVVLTLPWLRNALLFASVAYLCYLAWRIASAGSRIGFTAAEKPLGFSNAFMLQFINPKAYVVSTTLFSGFAFMPDAPLQETVVKLVVFNLIWVPVHLIWLYAGVMLGSMNLADRTQRIINICMALAMLAVVAVALISTR